jgi:hypothetical protein
MTSAFSNPNPKAKFKKHYVHEVVANANDSKLLALDMANTHRYQYRATVTVAGNSLVKPYDPIYLDGLPNGMSGYWTVISVTHGFGGMDGYYIMTLTVGTDVLGDVNPDAATAIPKRDVEGELAGTSLETYDTMISKYSTSPNSSDFPAIYTDAVSPKVTPPHTTIPNPTQDIYAVTPPTFKSGKRAVKWTSTSSGRVIR